MDDVSHRNNSNGPPNRWFTTIKALAATSKLCADAQRDFDSKVCTTSILLHLPFLIGRKSFQLHTWALVLGDQACYSGLTNKNMKKWETANKKLNTFLMLWQRPTATTKTWFQEIAVIDLCDNLTAILSA